MGKFANRLKELRKEKNTGQLELANYLSVARNTISNWEQEIAEPDIELLSKISAYFNVSVDYLLGRSDVPNPNQGIDIALAGQIEKMTPQHKAILQDLIDEFIKAEKMTK